MPTEEKAPAPSKRELLKRNVAHIRANCSTPDAITFCVLETADLVLELTEPQKELLPVA